jgi:hypothetical protein
MRRLLRAQSGYTLVELLISTAIMLTVTGAIFSLMNPAQGNAQAQPEVADVQQRMRVSADTLGGELLMAGAGPYQGASTGSLINFFAPIVPRRMGRTNADAFNVFRSDAVTLSYIPNSYSQTTISDPMPNVSAELKVRHQNNCPQAKDLCGFNEGMSLIIFDETGNFDTFTVTQVQSSAGHLQHRGQDMSIAYAPGAQVTQIVSNTWYLDRTTNQLRVYDGLDTDVPVVDNVVDLRFDYFGDPNPPRRPVPPDGVANCLYDALGNYLNLPVLAATEGSLTALTGAMLTDGPWCGGGSNRYDADLLRIRKVRVSLRVQAASPALRGTDTNLFMQPGSASGGERYVPDYRLQFDISPRNLNLAR